MSNRSALTLLCALLIVKSIFVIWFIVSGPLGLGPDESQYWTWSQQLDWGYYSKPPGVAWQIWLGTKLFGNTVLGVRFGAVLIGFFLSLSIYFLARACKLLPLTSFAAAIAFALTPLGMASSFLSITDGGLVLFWATVLALYCKNIDQPRQSYIFVALAILAGALFKWPIYLLWPLIIAWQLYQRKPLRSSLWIGIIISLFGLLPSVIWNSKHDWPTFRHVFATIHNPSLEEGTTDLIRGNFWEFIGAQAILLSPILFILLFFAAYALFKNWFRLESSLKFCGASSLVILIFYALQAIFKKMQGNWCDFVYPGIIVLIAWYCFEYAPKAKKWFWSGLVLSLILITALLSVPILQANNIVFFRKIAFKSNPFKHNLGWKELHGALEKAGYDPSNHFLFSDRYQTASILSFYGPEQHRAYFLNLQGIRKNQFSYWKGMEEEQVEKTGFFVSIDNGVQSDFDEKKEVNQEIQRLNPLFEHVAYIGSFPLFYSYNIPVKYARIYRCSGYNGKLPVTKDLY
jgi:hypothetical protein